MKKSEFRNLIREEIRKVLRTRKPINEVLVSSNDTYNDVLENPGLFISQVYGPDKASEALADDFPEYMEQAWLKFEKEWATKAMPIIKAFKKYGNKQIPDAFAEKLDKVASDDDSIIGDPESEIKQYPKTWTAQLTVLTAMASELK